MELVRGEVFVGRERREVVEGVVVVRWEVVEEFGVVMVRGEMDIEIVSGVVREMRDELKICWFSGDGSCGKERGVGGGVGLDFDLFVCELGSEVVVEGMELKLDGGVLEVEVGEGGVARKDRIEEFRECVVEGRELGDGGVGRRVDGVLDEVFV